MHLVLNFIAEHWKVLVFVLLAAVGLVILLTARMIGAVVGDDNVEKSYHDIGRFILAWAVSGLCLLGLTLSFAGGLFGGLAVAILGAVLMRAKNTAPEGCEDSQGFHEKHP